MSSVSHTLHLQHHSYCFEFLFIISHCQAIGQYLQPPDAAACRLASKQLAPVTAQHAGGHLHIVASHFQTLLHRDVDKMKGSTATAAAPAPAGEVPAVVTPGARGEDAEPDTLADTSSAAAVEQQQGGQLAATAAAAAKESHAMHTECSSSSISQLQGVTMPGVADSLARAAVGHTGAKVYVDIADHYSGTTWQRMFR